MGVFRKIWRLIFRRSDKITYLGRAGLIFEMDGAQYFVDSEMLSGDFDIAILWDNIYPYGNKEIKLSQKEREVILRELLKELKYEGVKADVHPFFYDNQ